MIPVKRISHITFATPDIGRQLAYFTEVLGLNAAEAGRERAFLTTRLGDLAVTLEPGAAQGCTGLSFQAAPDADLGALLHGLEAEGVKGEIRRDPAPGIPQAVVFTDPKGTLVEVFTAATPLAGGPNTGIGPLKLGHVAFCVPDPQAFVDFYCRVLGFRVSDWIEDWFAFLRCGVDHHSLNFVRAKTTRMHHVAFELKDWAQVQTACDFLGGHDIPLIWGPGRHGPGHNIYTYHRNPDDQIVELFTELDKMLDESLGYFDPRPWHRDRPQRPKVWSRPGSRDIWGTPPTPEFLRQRD